MSAPGTPEVVNATDGTVVRPDGKQLYGLDAEIYLKVRPRTGFVCFPKERRGHLRSSLLVQREEGCDLENEVKLIAWLEQVTQMPAINWMFWSLKSGVILCT